MLVSKRRLASSGFTIVEIIISITILVLVMSVAYSSLRQIIRSKQALDDTRDGRKLANAVLTRMTRELQLAYDGLPLLPPKDNLQQPYSNRINLISEPSDIGGVATSTIVFLALEGGQYMPDGGGHSGVVQITYRVEKDPDDPEADTYWLIREETPYIRPPERAYRERTMIFPVIKSLTSLSFRFYDAASHSWLNKWGKDEHVRLPAVIEFTVAIRSPAGKVEEFTTAVPIRSKGESN